MTAPLQTRLDEIRHRVRRLLWLNGLSRIVAVVFGSALFIGFVDWLVHIDEPVVRFLFSCGIVIAALWIAYRYLILPVLRPLTDSEIAIRIECRFPEFKDSLASTVQFLEQKTDPRLGSPQLQQKVIDETIAQIKRCDIEDVVETRPVYKALSVAVAVCVLVVVVAGIGKSATALALNRLVRPFSASAWPRETVLQLLDSDFQPLKHRDQKPLQLARGAMLELFVENVRGSLPEDVSMQYRFDSRESVTERLQQTTLVDENGHSHVVCVVQFIPTLGSVKFRAVGGDDDTMLWHRLEVVPPPTVENIQIQLTPPSYTGSEPERLPQGVSYLSGLLGTRVEITADVNKPLKFGKLHVKDTLVQPVELLDESRRFKTSFVIEEAGVYSYWFDLKDQQDFEDPEAPRYEIRGIADSPPKVYIETPTSDRNVTFDAAIPLRIIAEDDLSLKDLRLQYWLSNMDPNQEETIRIPLENGLQTFADVEMIWELSRLPLAEGMQIVLHAEAEDYYDLNEEQHIGRSVSRTLTIVSAAEKMNEISSRQSELLENIERAVKTQTHSHEQVEELLLQLQKAGQLRPEDIDLVRRVELDQKQVWSHLFNPADGVETVNRQLTEELNQNHLNDPKMEQRLQLIEDELKLLREETLPQMEQSLTRVRKGALTEGPLPEEQSPPSNRSSGSASSKIEKKSSSDSDHRSPGQSRDASDFQSEQNKRQQDRKEPENSQVQTANDPDSQITQLKQVSENQAAALESLEIMRRQLSRWQSRRDLSGELSDLIANQKTLNRESAELGRETFTKSAADLTPQQQADLARLAERQRKESQRLQKLREKLDEDAQKLNEIDPSTADLMRETSELLDDRKTIDRLQDAADRLERNDIGESTRQQQEALKDLNELQDLLRNSSASNAESLVKQLKQAEQALQTLEQKQDTLRQQSESANRQPDSEQRRGELNRLQNQQQQLQKETAATARKLKRLREYSPADSTERAASRMKQAASQLEQQSAQQAAEQQQQASEDLQQAQRELARSRQLAESRQQDDLLKQLLEAIGDLAKSEQEIIQGTMTLRDQLQKNDNRWNRSLLKSRKELSAQQIALRTIVDIVIEQSQPVEVFSLAFQGASRLMLQVEDRLEKRKVDQITIGLEANVRQRLLDIIAIFQPEPAKDNQKPQPDQPQNPQEGEQRNETQAQNSVQISQLIQLKLLKTLQQDLIRRTAELNAIRQRNGKLSAEQQTQLEAVTVEQGHLARLTQTLTQEFVETLEALEEEMQEEQ